MQPISTNQPSISSGEGSKFSAGRTALFYPGYVEISTLFFPFAAGSVNLRCAGSW